jgi:hypothetical protein
MYSNQSTILGAVLCTVAILDQASGYTFAGLSPRSTVTELARRYPHSTVADERVDLSDADAHDGIATLLFAGTGERRTLSIFFERRRPDGAAVYPPCARVLTKVQGEYGAPATVRNGVEERAHNRHFTWTAAGETLELSCFQMPGRGMDAERISIGRH